MTSISMMMYAIGRMDNILYRSAIVDGFTGHEVEIKCGKPDLADPYPFSCASIIVSVP